MIKNLYSIYDTASGIYSSPIFAEADGQVTREFQDLALNKEHPFGQHPEDYALYRLGRYNDQTGKLDNEENICLATALELVALSRNKNKETQLNLDKQIKEAMNENGDISDEKITKLAKT